MEKVRDWFCFRKVERVDFVLFCFGASNIKFSGLLNNGTSTPLNFEYW